VLTQEQEDKVMQWLRRSTEERLSDRGLIDMALMIANAAPLPGKDAAQQQEWLVNGLDAILKSERRARRALADDINRRLMATPVITAAGFDGKRIVTEHQCVPRKIEEYGAFVLALLLDEDRGFKGLLRRCRLAECNRFFLAHVEKGPRPSYCCTEHRLRASALDAKNRVARYRERVRRVLKEESK